MKISKRALYEALAILVRVIDHKSSVSALQHIKLSATHGTVTVTATNLDQTLTSEIPGEGELTICLPGKILAGLVKPENRRDDGDVNFEVEDENEVIVTVDSFKSHLATIPVYEFPTENTDVFNLVAMWPAEDLAKSVAHCLPAISTDPTRPHINCLCLDEVMAATDGHRLHTAKLPTEIPDPILLPSPAAKLLPRLLKHSENVIIARSQNRVKMKAGAWTLETKLVDAQFPPIDQVIPRHHPTRITVDGSAMTKALKRIGTLTQKNGGVRVRINGVVELSSGDEGMEGSVSIEPVENNHPADSEDIVLGINLAYLSQCLKAAKGEVSIELGGSLDPILVTHGETAALSVIMPMRL